MPKVIWLVKFVILGALATHSLAKATSQENTLPQTITYFYTNQPPFEFVSKDGVASGIAAEKAQHLFANTPYSLAFAFDSLNRGIDNLHAGRYDISTAVSPTKALHRTFYISNKPLYFINLSAIRKHDTTPVTQIEQISTVAYAALSENSFTFIERYLQAQHPLSKRYDVKTFSQGVRLVELDKLPYFLTYLTDQQTDYGDALTTDLLMQLPVYIIVSKHHPHASAIIETVNTHL